MFRLTFCTQNITVTLRCRVHSWPWRKYNHTTTLTEEPTRLSHVISVHNSSPYIGGTFSSRSGALNQVAKLPWSCSCSLFCLFPLLVLARLKIMIRSALRHHKVAVSGVWINAADKLTRFFSLNPKILHFDHRYHIYLPSQMHLVWCRWEPEVIVVIISLLTSIAEQSFCVLLSSSILLGFVSKRRAGRYHRGYILWLLLESNMVHTVSTYLPGMNPVGNSNVLDNDGPVVRCLNIWHFVYRKISQLVVNSWHHQSKHMQNFHSLLYSYSNITIISVQSPAVMRAFWRHFWIQSAETEKQSFLLNNTVYKL